MKITTLLLSLTACVFAAGYVIFAPRTNDVPVRAKLETPLEKDADTGKLDKVAAVPARAKEVLAPPVQQAPAVKKNDGAVGEDARKDTRKEEATVRQRQRSKAETASAKPASPAPAVPVDEATKPAAGGVSVPPGHQAVVVEPTRWVKRSSNVGSRVNVFATTFGEDGKPQNKIILRDVLVLAEDQGRANKDGAALPWLATLAIAKEDLPVIEEAKRLGTLTIMTKVQPGEIGPPAPPAPPVLQATPAPQAPNGPVIITESPSLPMIITGSPKLPVIITESPPNLPKIVEGQR